VYRKQKYSTEETRLANVDVGIWFIYSLEIRSRSPTEKLGPPLQLHGRILRITITGVPEAELNSERPTSPILWMAEMAFLEAVRGQCEHEHDLIRWQARLGSPDGLVLSTFKLFI